MMNDDRTDNLTEVLRSVRPPGSTRWLTHSDRASEAAMCDELLSDTSILPGSDLRVIFIRPAGPGTSGLAASRRHRPPAAAKIV